MFSSCVVLVALFGSAYSILDTECTASGAYTSNAVSCMNVQSDKFCDMAFAASLVKAGGTDERPAACYNGTGGVDPDIKNAAISTCPRTCGYCCKTTAYNCENARIPFQDCATISPQQCVEPTWRPLIERDCPAACGFCNMGGCIDVAPYCTKQHCVTIGLETFVATNCKRTCNLCTSTVATTKSPGTGTGNGCPANPVDNKNCASWVRNGYCTNPFYDRASRIQGCPKACGLC